MDNCYKLRVLDTLRGCIATDPLTTQQFQGVIRQFPLTAVPESADGVLLPPAVSLYSPVDVEIAAVTVGGAGVGRFETQYSCVLEIALFCGAKNTPDAQDTLMRNLLNVTDLFQRALLKYREDVTPPVVGTARLWHRLYFLKPATVMERIPGQMLYTMTRFTLFSQRRIP